MTTAADWTEDFIVHELTEDEARALGVGIPDGPPSDDTDQPKEPHYDQPDPAAVKPPRRPRNAAAYERKLTGVLQGLITELAPHEATQPDAAVLIMHGPKFCTTWGNAAAEHDQVARAIEWLSQPTDNALLLAMMATVPIVLQVVRNHEPVLQPQPRGLRLPFLKDSDGNPRTLRLPKVGIRLTNVPGYAAATNDPQKLREHVFSNPDIIAQLRKQGVKL